MSEAGDGPGAAAGGERMSAIGGNDCAAARQALLELAVAGRLERQRPWRGLQSAAVEHMASCSQCDRYAGGLLEASRLLASGSLYSRALRARTIAAVASDREAPAGRLVAVLLPSAVASLALSVVVPVWLLAWLLGAVVPSGWLSLTGAVVLCASLSLAAAGSGVAALVTPRGGHPGAARLSV